MKLIQPAKGAIPPTDPLTKAPLASRRALLIGLGAAAAASADIAASQATRAAPADEVPSSEPANERQLFYGPHQAGIVTPQPAAGLLVAFDSLATDRSGLEELLRLLTMLISALAAGGAVIMGDPRLPPAESGILGPVVAPDDLTITVAVGSSLFENERYGLAERKPSQLVRMERFPNDSLDAKFCHGDLLVQFCANTPETNLHALRDLIKNLPKLISPRWKIEGLLPARTVKRLGADTSRNMLGFKDGTANIKAADAELMNQLVWVQPGSPHEPAWTAGGSYQVVRIIRTLVERWDRTPLQEQESIIGRKKVSGAPLGRINERDEPDYSANPGSSAVPSDAHIRLANPRSPKTEANRILRRGYNFSRGLTSAGQLDLGLLFVCFQSDLNAGFLTVQKRLNGEPLEEYIKPIGGGYFFALPGVEDERGFLGQAMLMT